MTDLCQRICSRIKDLILLWDAVKYKLPEEILKPAGLKNEKVNVIEQKNNDKNRDKKDINSADEDKEEETQKLSAIDKSVDDVKEEVKEKPEKDSEKG